MMDDVEPLDVIWASEYYREELMVHWLVDDSTSPAWFFLEYAGDHGFNFDPLFEELCMNFVVQDSPQQREVIQYYKAHGARVTDALVQAIQAMPSTFQAGSADHGRATRRVLLVLEMLRD
jgi:hypothetical protein